MPAPRSGFATDSWSFRATSGAMTAGVRRNLRIACNAQAPPPFSVPARGPAAVQQIARSAIWAHRFARILDIQEHARMLRPERDAAARTEQRKVFGGEFDYAVFRILGGRH